MGVRIDLILAASRKEEKITSIEQGYEQDTSSFQKLYQQHLNLYHLSVYQ